jgi:hypothetical protein
VVAPRGQERNSIHLTVEAIGARLAGERGADMETLKVIAVTAIIAAETWALWVMSWAVAGNIGG